MYAVRSDYFTTDTDRDIKCVTMNDINESGRDDE